MTTLRKKGESGGDVVVDEVMDVVTEKYEKELRTIGGQDKSVNFDSTVDDLLIKNELEDNIGFESKP